MDYDLTSAVKAEKFMGSWVDVWPQGRTRIKLKSSSDVYNICPPPSRVNNVLVGRTWIDTFGDMRVNNLTTGASASIKFTECNMFGTGRWGVNGKILDKDGNVKYRLSGKWNEEAWSMTAAGRPRRRRPHAVDQGTGRPHRNTASPISPSSRTPRTRVTRVSSRRTAVCARIARRSRRATPAPPAR